MGFLLQNDYIPLAGRRCSKTIKRLIQNLSVDEIRCIRVWTGNQAQAETHKGLNQMACKQFPGRFQLK